MEFMEFPRGSVVDVSEALSARTALCCLAELSFNFTHGNIQITALRELQ